MKNIKTTVAALTVFVSAFAFVGCSNELEIQKIKSVSEVETQISKAWKEYTEKSGPLTCDFSTMDATGKDVSGTATVKLDRNAHSAITEHGTYSLVVKGTGDDTYLQNTDYPERNLTVYFHKNDLVINELPDDKFGVFYKNCKPSKIHELEKHKEYLLEQESNPIIKGFTHN